MFIFVFFFCSYIHATYPHDFFRVVFNLNNLRWSKWSDTNTCLLQRHSQESLGYARACTLHTSEDCRGNGGSGYDGGDGGSILLR